MANNKRQIKVLGDTGDFRNENSKTQGNCFYANVQERMSSHVEMWLDEGVWFNGDMPSRENRQGLYIQILLDFSV